MFAAAAVFVTRRMLALGEREAKEVSLRLSGLPVGHHRIIAHGDRIKQS
jgi:hypothetical protein